MRQQAFSCLSITDPIEKVLSVQLLYTQAKEGAYVPKPQESLQVNEQSIPGRPKKPILVPPLKVAKRAMHTIEGRSVAIHALAHIEFNAINLALDAIWRFSDMPQSYYWDWLQVAYEESKHFFLLKNHLMSFGYDYGDFSAHDSLWEMVDKTKEDILARMALVPRTMEAKGLDAVPMMKDRFIQAKDQAMVDILETILKDEIGHVQIGNRWFNYLCELKSIDPISTFESLCEEYRAPTLRPPFNIDARKQAGFTDQEIHYLQQLGNK